MKPILVLSNRESYTKTLEKALEKFRDVYEVVPPTDFSAYFANAEFAERTCLVILDPSSDPALWSIIGDLKTEHKTRRIPVIVVAAKKNDVDRLKAVTLDVEDYFSFPFSKTEFEYRVARAIEMYHEGSNYRDVVTFLKKYRKIAETSAKERDEMENIVSAQEAVIEMGNKERMEIDGIRGAQEAVFEMSRQELKEANEKLRQSYDAKISALKEKAELQLIFGRYIAPEVIEVLMSKGGAERLAGEKQDVTILFADIRGFTSICEGLPPYKTLVLLNEFFSALSDTVIEHHGILDKYIGDNIMAIFGAPVHSEKHVENAVLAALAMQRRFITLKEKWVFDFGVQAGLGIGLNCGGAVVGNVGCYHKLSYTAIGDVVNTAARFEQCASDGQVIFGEALRKRLGEDFLQTNKLQIQTLEPVTLRGKAGTHAIYAIAEVK